MKRLFMLFVPVLLIAAPVSATLQYTGEQTLWQDTVWTGDVLIDGILTVAPGATLEIRPGTRVRFTRIDSNRDGIGESELFVQGVFRALGSQEEPIVFTSAESAPRPADWGAVNMMASAAENVLSHCVVEYGYRGFHAHFASAALSDSVFRHNRRGAQFQESTVSIDRCRFEANLNGIQFRDSTVTLVDSVVADGYWGVRCVYSTLEMSGCRIENNLVNGISLRDSDLVFERNRVIANRRGVYLQRSHGTLVGNVVRDNSEHGIFLEESDGRILRNDIAANGRAGLRIIDSPAEITDNRIVDNDEYGLINDGETDLRIEGNWWGTTGMSLLSRLVRDGSDRPGTGKVVLVAPLERPPF